jgi:DNA-binding FrmR family transcriptional regulator
MMIGHLEGIKRMVDNDEDCSDILIQLSAVRSALNSTGKLILSDHINHCLIHAYEENDTEVIDKLNDAIDKFLK